MLSKNKLVNAFISALEQFGQPNALFKVSPSELKYIIDYLVRGICDKHCQIIHFPCFFVFLLLKFQYIQHLG